MAKTKASVYVDDELLRAAKELATRTGRDVDDVLEEALREFLVHPADILDGIRSREKLTDEEAMEIALREIEAHRSAK